MYTSLIDETCNEFSNKFLIEYNIPTMFHKMKNVLAVTEFFSPFKIPYLLPDLTNKRKTFIFNRTNSIFFSKERRIFPIIIFQHLRLSFRKNY